MQDGDGNWKVVIDSEVTPTANVGTSVVSEEPPIQTLKERLAKITKFQRPDAVPLKHASVYDINSTVELPNQQAKKKNKNDFYRYLLMTNSDHVN